MLHIIFLLQMEDYHRHWINLFFQIQWMLLGCSLPPCFPSSFQIVHTGLSVQSARTAPCISIGKT